jgi:TolB protein
MPKPIDRSRIILTFVLGLLILALFTIAVLIVLLRMPRPTTPQPSQTASEIGSQSSETPTYTQANTATPTGEASAQAVSTEFDLAAPNSDMFIISMKDGKYNHLFLYNPEFLAPTRLTMGAWDDIDPKVSPDESEIAFSSNKFGYWDIYVMDLVTGATTQITYSQDYDGRPTWSNDGQWLAYETYSDNHFEINIISVTDPSQGPLLLTEENSNNYSPAWSPLGREIAFVSDRDGNQEIWLARLDNYDERFIDISNLPDSNEYDPSWSPDGTGLAWSSDAQGENDIEVHQGTTNSTFEIGKGIQPHWSVNSSTIYTFINEANRVMLTGYSVDKMLQSLPLLEMPSPIAGYDLISFRSISTLGGNFLNPNAAPLPTLWQSTLSLATSSSHRLGVVSLPGVSAPYPYLLDSADEAFTSLRGAIGYATGWDFLANLDSAYMPLTEPPDPGLPENWLYTGRAIAVNSLPLQAGWMVISREEYNGVTYWRVFLKALHQDGSQGLPLKNDCWDLSSRFSGETIAYEQGGKSIPPPSGYWIDFTEIALQYGWQRVAANANWRTFFEATNFNIFVLKDSLDWHTAMSQLYPPEALATYTPIPVTSQTVNQPAATYTQTKNP